MITHKITRVTATGVMKKCRSVQNHTFEVELVGLEDFQGHTQVLKDKASQVVRDKMKSCHWAIITTTGQDRATDLLIEKFSCPDMIREKLQLTFTDPKRSKGNR